MSEYFDLYGPDGQLIYRMPKGMGAQMQKVAPQPSTVSNMSDVAARLSGAPTGLTNFGPGTPMQPAHPQGTPPRQYQYPVGYNSAQRPRSSESVGFDTLRQLARMYDVASICIRTRINQLRGLDWDIVPWESGRGISDKYKDEIAAVRQFFTKPDGDHLLDEWVAMAARDWLELDALTVYKRRYKVEKKGRLPLYSLELVDGETIKPLLDEKGRIPDPPYVAYQQFLFGIPQQEFTKQDIIYRPYWLKTDSPYGEPPLESILLQVNTDLKQQWNFLNYFTEGNVPDGFGEAPESWNPQQIQEWQDTWDALMAGDPTWKQKIKFVPHGFNFTQLREPSFDPAYPMFLLKKTLAAFQMTPAEVGFTDDVNRATGESQENTEERKGLMPAVRWFERLLTDVIRTDFNLPYLRFKYLGVEPKEDTVKQAQANEIKVRNGVISPDEWREDDGYQVDNDNRVPRVFITPGTPIPVNMLTQRVMDQMAQPQPDNQPVDEEADGQENGPGSDADATDAAQEAGSNGSKPQPAPKGTDENGDAAKALAAMHPDLRRWRDNTLKRIRDGQAAKRFASDAIPPELADAIHTRLTLSKTADDVRAAFDHVSEGLRLPLAKGDIPGPQPATNPIGRMVAELRLWATYQQHFNQVRAGVAREVIAELERRGLFTKRDTLRKGVLHKEADDPLKIVLEWASLIKPTVEALTPLHQSSQSNASQRLLVHVSTYLRNARAEAYAAKRAAELVGLRPVMEAQEFERPDGSKVTVKVPKRDSTGTFVTEPTKRSEYAITDTTRDMIQRLVTQAQEEGWPKNRLQKAIEDDYAFSPTRALTISRTETGYCDNSATIEGYGDADVRYVDVVDGDDFDDECRTANGQRWTLEEARKRPLEHPNCTRMFLPVVE